MLFMTKRRMKEMKEQALKFGFSFSEVGNKSILKEIPSFPLLQMTDVNLSSEYNVMQKIEGSTVMSILDLSLRTSVHDDSADLFTAVLFKSDSLNLPSFYLKPE